MSFEQQLANNVANVSNFIKEAITQSQQVAEQYPGSQGIKTTALTCVQLTIKFKSIMQEATKPLFIHMPQIEKVCKVMITGLKKLSDEVVSLSGNIWVGKVVENAIEATQNFSFWLVTNFETYLLTSVPEVNFLNAYPGDAQTVVQEMANVPLWLLHVLYDTRQATQVVEKKVLQSEVDLKTYQAQMQEMFERQKLCFLNQQDSKSTELLQKIEHQEALITDLKYRAQEAKRSLLAGKKDEFAQIEAGQAKIEELTKTVADLEKRLKIADDSVNERTKMINELDAEKTVTAQQNQSLLKKVTALEDKLEKELAAGFAHKVAPQAQALTQMTTVDVEKEKRLENNIAQLKTQLASVQKENQHILLKMKSLQVQMAEKLKAAAANKEGTGEEEATSESTATTTSTSTSTSVAKSGITWAQQIDTNAIVAPFFEQVSPIEVNYDSAMLWMSESDKHVCLAHLICNNIYDNAFVKLLGNVFVTGKAAENVVFAVLKIFEEQGRTMELIKRMIDQEVDNSDTSNQLFRGEDFPPRTIRAFTRIKGVQYLHFVLGSLIEEIIESDLCILMDNRFSGTNTNEYLPPDDNTIALANEWCQKFFDAILAARNCLPMEFYEIANYLSYKTSLKYSQVEGAVQGSVAGFIFLRFFCPCITSPLNFGFKKPAKGAQTTLLLIGKVIQSLANGVKSFKEESYANLNQFLTKNQSSLGQYYRHISSYPQRPYGDSLYHKILSHYINSELPKMNEKIVLVHPTKGDEFENVRTIPTHTIIEVAPLTQFESLLDSIPKQPNIKIPNKDIKIVDRAKMPTSLADPLVGAILQVFVENQNVSLAFIKVLLEKRSEAAEWVLDNVKSLFSLFTHLNALDTLFIYVIVTEAGAVDSEKMFIHDSITKLLFQQISYSPEVTEWLMSTCFDLLGAIRDVKAKDEERIKEVFGIFLRQFFDSLAYAPKLIWMFCVALGEYSAINVFKFLLINLLSKLLEDPSSYRIDRDANIPTEQLSILTTMSDMVLTLANSDSDESATEAQAQAYELFNVFQAWIENPCEGVVEIPQEESMVWCEALNLTDALLLNIPDIKNQLKTLNKVVYNVHFFAKNLYSSFKPAALPNTNDLSFSQFELEENIRKNRGTWNNTPEPVKPEGKEKGDKSLKLDSPSMKEKKGVKDTDSPMDSPKTDRSKASDSTTPRKNDSTVSSKFNIKNIGKK